MNALIKENVAKGLGGIKTALDEWALHDLEEYDYPGASRARILQGDVGWREWQSAWSEEDGGETAPPEGWRAIGPVNSCNCEDWPCCIHTDDYVFVPD